MRTLANSAPGLARAPLSSARQSFARGPVSDTRLTPTGPAADKKCLRFGVSQRRLRRGAVLLLLPWTLGASACGAPPASSGPLFGTGVFHPPPKPGGSISHTQMCECKACDPAGCCDGPEDDPPPTECTGADDFDFSASSACGGIQVRSCESRCTRQVWRVRAGQACEEKRPQSCCQAG